MTRYQRQIVLDEIGEDGQEKLSAARILCIGAGGLGAPCLLYLAAAGIGQIGIADFDRIDESNLQRQILYDTADVGAQKAQKAAERLKALNPQIDIHTYEEGLHAGNIEDLFKNYDLIVDGTDHFEAKFLINDACVKFGKPWIYGAINRFEAQVSLFNPEHGPCYRCLYPHKPREVILNCAEAGVIGAVAGIAGTSQALQAIQHIVGHESFETLQGRLWILDGKTMQTKLLSLAKDPDCPVCSKLKEDISLTYQQPVCSSIREISAAEAKTYDGILIDVRELEEWNEGHAEGAQHLALSELMAGHVPSDLSKDRDLVLYCRKGKRSLQAAEILKAKGYENVISVAGGYEAWCES